MRILAIVLCLATCCGYAQEDQIRQILQESEQCAAVVKEVFGFSPTSTEETKSTSVSVQALGQESQSAEQEGLHAKWMVQTYGVRIAIGGGFTFYVADYYDGTVVVTCLDGPLNGLQTVYVNGVVQIESTDSAWYPNYFIHWYPGGVIYSYINKQVMEVY